MYEEVVSWELWRKEPLTQMYQAFATTRTGFSFSYPDHEMPSDWPDNYEWRRFDTQGGVQIWPAT